VYDVAIPLIFISSPWIILWTRKNSNSIPSKTTAQTAQWVEQLTRIQEAVGLISAGEQFFLSSKINAFCIHVFLNSALIALLLGIPSTHGNGT